MKKKFTSYILLYFVCWCIILIVNSGCANIVPPGGGPRDTLPPMLITALPKDSTTNFNGNRIVLNFNEYVELQNTFENMVFSPLPNNVPIVNYNFRTVSIKIQDTLEPNTTYSINFGNSLRDINEGNVLKNFTYVFSTGNTISQDSISGKVIMAETGKIDSTLIVVLHRNTDDSAVAKEKPRYISKLDGQGRFQFKYLPAGTFALYAIPNEYSKHYDDTTKPFAFADSLINTVNNRPVTLYAYTLPKKDSAKAIAKESNEKVSKKDTAIRIQPNIQAGRQDILSSLELNFSRKIKTFDTIQITLADTNYNAISGYKIKIDTAKNTLSINNTWLPENGYRVIFYKGAITDTSGFTLPVNDTIRFITKRMEDYGSIKLRFANIDLSKNPVLEFVQADKITESIKLTQKEFYKKLFAPGDYDLRILYDKNNNGVWDAGRFFGAHQQPEIVMPINTKVNIKANWDNEKDITL